MKYVKKPVVIDAMQYVGQADLTELKNWVETFGVEWRTYFNADANNDGLSINTLEGVMNVSVGDYIIRGVKGEFYACKPDVFDMTYDVVLGENLPDIYNKFPKLAPENIPLADRIAGRVDEFGNPITREELITRSMPKKVEEGLPNDFISRRIAGEIDELGNEITNETRVLDEVGPILNSIMETNEEPSPVAETKPSPKTNKKPKSKKKKK